MSSTQQIAPEIDLANRVMALCYALSSVTTAWAGPLIDPVLTGQSSLRNRLFCFLATGMMDAGWEYPARRRGLEVEAEKLNSKSVPYYLDVFSAYIALAVDVLEQITREEMIVLSEMRNQWAHGNWTEIHKERRTVYFANNARIEKEKIDSSYLMHLLRESGGPDDFIAPIRERICTYRTFFWSVDRILAMPEVRTKMAEDVLLHRKWTHPNVAFRMPPLDFRPDPTTNSAFRTLAEMPLEGVAGDIP